MINGDDSSPARHDERLEEVILAYMDAMETGRPIDRQRFIDSHSEFRRELEQFFIDRDQIERVAAPIRGEARRDLGPALGPDGSTSVHGRPGSGHLGDSIHALGQLGDFCLLREIGRGGMGIVYEAEQLSLNRRVAVKVLPFAAAIDTKYVQRFKNEAVAAGMLNHVNIVQVHSVGTERGVHFYSMQLVEGQSLAALIAELRQHPMSLVDNRFAETDAFVSSPNHREHSPTDSPREQTSVDTVTSIKSETAVHFCRELSSQHVRRDDRYFRSTARIIMQAADALQHAHDAGIVHRDVKPANLLIDSSGQLRITDFGLAQFRSEMGITRTGDTPGTLRYMSPEQAAGGRSIVDHRTDVYSLGATFYELLTLSPIFAAGDAQELLTQIFDVQPTPLRRVDPSIPIELETIVLKATNKSPEDRYNTAGDMAADLRRYLNDQPILARRPSPIDRARKWSRRHPSAVLASLVMMLVVSAVSITAFVLVDGAYRREQLRADEAETQFQLARRSIDELVRVSEEELAYNPSAESLRRRLLSSALSYYQEFLQQRREDPDAQESLDDASSHVEKILGDLQSLRAMAQIKMLQQETIVDELRLSDIQQAKALDLVKSVEDLWQDAFGDMGKVSATELDRRFMERSRLNEADLKAMLTEPQLRRLYQLDLQADVAAAMREPEVLEKLKLTEKQRDRIKTVEQQEMSRRRSNHLAASSEKRSEAPGSISALSKNKRILEVLTIDQRIAWRELTGTPLEGIRRW